jgi:hypothetical protein
MRRKAKALSADVVVTYSWFAYLLATEGLRCEDPQMLKDIVGIWKTDESEGSPTADRSDRTAGRSPSSETDTGR